MRHGLRARLGRPGSRTVVFWSLAAALICGLFAASAASWVAWTNGKPHPDAAEVRAVFTEVLPNYEFGDIAVARDIFTFNSQPLSWDNLSSVLSFSDGGEYQLGSSGGGVLGAPATGGAEAAPKLLERLRATGWEVYRPEVQELVTCHTKMCETPVPTTYTAGVARRSDLVLTFFVNSAAGPEETFISVSLQRTAPASVWPAGMAGGLVGAVLAWFVFAWASRRPERGRLAGSATACFVVTMLCWWGPALLGITGMITHLVAEPHPQWHPLWKWLGQPTFARMFFFGAACALLSLALSAASTRRAVHRPIAT